MNSFPEIVKSILKQLSTSDYPVLDSRKFFEIWLTFILDNSLVSMKDVANHNGTNWIFNIRVSRNPRIL